MSIYMIPPASGLFNPISFDNRTYYSSDLSTPVLVQPFDVQALLSNGWTMTNYLSTKLPVYSTNYTTTSSNLLVNAGNPSSWVDNTSTSGLTVSYATNGPGHGTDANSLAVTVSGYTGDPTTPSLSAGSLMYYNPGFTIDAGQNYQTTLWVKSLSGSIPVVLFCRDDANGYRHLGTAIVNAVSTQWTQVTINTYCDFASLNLYLRASVLGNGTVYFSWATMNNVTIIGNIQPYSSASIQAKLFGLHLNNVQSYNNFPSPTITWFPTQLSQSGKNLVLGVWRFWDNGMTAADLFTASPSTYNFTGLGQFLAIAKANGIQVVYCIGKSPAFLGGVVSVVNTSGTSVSWVSGNTFVSGMQTITINNNVYNISSVNSSTSLTLTTSAGTQTGVTINSQYNAVPTNFTQYINFVSALASYCNTNYPGGVKFELWNETDSSSFWTGSVNQNNTNSMVYLAQLMYAATKAINTNIKVIAPNITLEGLYWLNSYLQNGGLTYFDEISYHFYPTANPEYDIQFVNDIRAVLNSHSLSNINISMTEGSYGFGTSSVTTSTQRQASLARSYIMAALYGVINFNWYMWYYLADTGPYYCNLGNLGTGSFANTPNQITPAGTAFIIVGNWLVGSTILGCIVGSDGTWIVTLQLSNSYTANIVWNINGNFTFNVPSSWNASTYSDLNGNTNSIVNSQVSISTTPILIK